MPHFFEKRDRWGHGLGLWVVVGMAFVLPLAAWSVSRLRFDHDVQHVLSNDSLPVRQLAWYQQHFEADDQILISWEGSAIEDPRVEQFAQQLLGTTDAEGIRRGGLKQVASVQTPAQTLARMTDSKVDRTEAMQRLTGVLVGPGPIWCQLTTAGLNQRARSLRLLKELAAKHFGLELHITDRFGARAEQLAAEAEEDESETAAEEPATTTSPVASENTAAAAPLPVEEIAGHDFQISWPGMHSSPKVLTDFITWAKELRIPVAGQPDGEALISECFVHAGQPAAIAVTLSEAGRADQQGTLELIRETAQQAGILPSALEMSGSPVLAVQLDAEISRIVWNPAAPWYLPHQRSILMFACGIGLILTCWMLRSVRLGLIVFAVSGFATLLCLALVPFWDGTLNTVLIVAPILILTVMISVAIPVVKCWKTAAGRDPRLAIARTILAVRLPVGLGAIGTAIALGALMTSPLIPIRMFGLYAAVGSLISAVAVLYGIPALLQISRISSPLTTGTEHGSWAVVGRLIVRYSTAITAASVIVSAAAVYGLTKLQTETSPIAYLPQSIGVMQSFNAIEQHLGGTMPLETVVSFGKQAREDLSFTQRMEVVRTIEQNLRQMPEISGTMSLADFYPIQQPLAEEASLKEKAAFRNLAKAIETSARKDQRSRAMYYTPKLATEFNDAGDELWRITAQVAATSRADHQTLLEKIDINCRSVIKYHADTRHLIIGEIPLLQATQQALFDTAFYAVLAACGGIAVVMMVVTRDVWSGLLSMIPNLLPVGAVLGFCTWNGISVDTSVLLTIFIGLGLSVTRSVHLLTAYRVGLITGLSRRRAIVQAVKHTGPMIVQTSLMLGLSMLGLCFSPVPLLSNLGAMLSGLQLATLLSSVILTPALLAGPLGWLMFYVVQKQRNRLKAVTEDPDLDELDRHAAHIMPPKPQIVAASQPDSASRFEPRESRQRKRRR